MSAKHTPGPWQITGDDSSTVTAERPGKPYSMTVCDATGYKPERQANARLIAAAPDLLAACERMLPWVGKMIADGAHLNSVAPGDAVGAMEQAHAAIAKARQS